MADRRDRRTGPRPAADRLHPDRRTGHPARLTGWAGARPPASQRGQDRPHRRAHARLRRPVPARAEPGASQGPQLARGPVPVRARGRAGRPGPQRRAGDGGAAEQGPAQGPDGTGLAGLHRRALRRPGRGWSRPGHAGPAGRLGPRVVRALGRRAPDRSDPGLSAVRRGDPARARVGSPRSGASRCARRWPDPTRDGLVVDLRSGTYAASWNGPPGRTAAIRVIHEQGDRRTVASHFNKATKGRLLRALAESDAVPGERGRAGGRHPRGRVPRRAGGRGRGWATHSQGPGSTWSSRPSESPDRSGKYPGGHSGGHRRHMPCPVQPRRVSSQR